ncbi:MAG: hypothetical protein HC873_01530 [Leptolyngbyaceae cyanobacterium SL_1_1]|nr:hypothetical protein [Leptolyngbyaceae cyanobacterium RM1_1_2]NJO08537.1 hypothetical protein [Leptolyngbyaceae cyanobacterium SL_1_1]
MNLLNSKSLIGRWLFVSSASAALLLGASAAKTQAVPAVLVAQSPTLVTSSAQAETLYLNEDRSYAYNLELEQAATIGDLYLPAGTVIQGSYEPAGDDGLRYVARAALVNGQSYAISAVSDVIDDQKDPRDTSGGAIAEDAAVGAAGGAVLGEVFGGIDLGEVLGGAAAGVAVGNLTADQVVVIEPDEPIMLYAQ